MSECDDRCVPIALPPGWGRAMLHAGAHAERTPHTCRSYDALGRQLVWEPNGGAHAEERFACDIEAMDASATAVGTRFGCAQGELPLRWTLTEVMAKLTRTPVLVYLRRNGLELPPCDPSALLFLHRDAVRVEAVVRQAAGRVTALCSFGRAVAAIET